MFLVVIIALNIDDIITCQMSIIRQLYKYALRSKYPTATHILYKERNIIIICLIVGRIIIINNILKCIY